MICKCWTESHLKKFKHSGMDFRQRRLLWLGVQSNMRNTSRIDAMKQTLSYNNGENDRIVQCRDSAKERPLYEFLKDIGLERYYDGIEILVEHWIS